MLLKDPVLQAGAGPTGLLLALTLAKNGVPVRIVDKDATFHLGQRGSGIQPRTLEIYNYLGMLPDYLNNGGLLVPRCVYEMPEGVKPAKIFEMSRYEEPTPSVPFVSSALERGVSVLTLVLEEPLGHWARAQRGDSP